MKTVDRVVVNLSLSLYIWVRLPLDEGDPHEVVADLTDRRGLVIYSGTEEECLGVFNQIQHCLMSNARYFTVLTGEVVYQNGVTELLEGERR